LNVREAVQSTGSWDEENDPIAEMNKSILPILADSLNYDIEQAAEECIKAVNSGVSHGPGEAGRGEGRGGEMTRSELMSTSKCTDGLLYLQK
jgi:hypothetical protein